MSEYTPTTENVRSVFAHGGAGQTTERRRAMFNLWLAAHDAEVWAEAESDPAKDERLVRYIAMATPLGYQSALTVVQQMTLMIQAETDARRAGVVAEEPEWEYVPGWIAADGRARISQGVIAPSYVADFIAEGGEVVRRRVSKFETVTADMVPVKQGDDDA